ncbi:MAG: aminopeptidase P N-terminal domain-containing protein [Flavobacteriales bacterium]|nr:aminopeptidase P N-terminal domain-containing protein [Flavobacteriales bacterium]
MRYFTIYLFLFSFLNLTSQENSILTISNLRPDTLGIYDTDLLPPIFHKERRKLVRTFMPENSMAIFCSAKNMLRANDVDFEFHQDPNFYYLTGLNEPNSILVLFKNPYLFDKDTIRELLLIKERNLNSETWVGKKLGIKGSELLLNVQRSYNIDNFKLDMFNFLEIDSLFIHDNFNMSESVFPIHNDSVLVDTLGTKLKVNNTLIFNWLAELREIKTKEEMVLLRKAISITCDAQTELMKVLKPGMKEFQAEAVVEAIFKLNGAEYPGYPSIVGAAENSCILHYTTNRKTMKGNHLLLSDVGAEYHGYTADVTRTIPVDGKYSEEEKTIYNIVLEAQNKAIKECKVGNPFYITNTIATTVVSQRLQELGIIKSPHEIRRYFMHGTSHYLGLDVHDPGTGGDFQANTVITVEPGIYIKEGSPCDPKWWNIGVRIEDDILITEGEPENLSGCVPRTIEEIESTMKAKPIVFKNF